MKSVFAKNLISRRTHLGLSQEQASKKLNVNVKTYAKWEEGRSKPNIETLAIIADVFHITNLYDFIKG